MPKSVDERALREIHDEAIADEAALERPSEDLPPPAVIRELGQIKLTGLDGKAVALESLWSDRAAAMVFLRHYG